MFERLTDGARQVVVLAQAEAVSLGHRYIGTEHLLLGLLSDTHGVAGAVLGGAGLTAGAVRAAVERLVGPGEPGPDDAAALRSIGIDLDAVRASTEATFGTGALDLVRRSRRRRLRRRCKTRPGQPYFTPRSKKVLELALRESLRLGDRHVGPEHILLGVVIEGEGVAAMILSEALGLAETRQRALAALGKLA